MNAPFSLRPLSGLLAPPADPDAPRPRVSHWVGLLVALLLHLIGIWMLISRDPILVHPPVEGERSDITYLAPLAVAPPEPRSPPRATPPEPKRQARKLRLTPKTPPNGRAITPRTAVAQAPDNAPSVAQPELTKPEPSEDFSAHLEAARKRRSEERAQDPAVAQAPSESESDRANRIARENIAFQQRGQQGNERDQTGGVFQLREVRQGHAAFMFRGWNQNFRRNWSQLVDVEQGNEIDIENAVVTRMIALIRSHKTGDFIWESHRLGRQITLSANLSDEARLRAFLLKEFFPEYVRSGR